MRKTHGSYANPVVDRLPDFSYNGGKVENIMNIKTKKKNKNISKMELMYMTQFLAENILGKRLAANVSLTIHFKKLKKNHWAYCEAYMLDGRKYRDFTLEVNKKLKRKKLIKTIAHELVHVKQYARNEFDHKSGIDYKWKGSIVSIEDKDYVKMPWEVEARSYEEPMYEKYINHLRENPPKFLG